MKTLLLFGLILSFNTVQLHKHRRWNSLNENLYDKRAIKKNEGLMHYRNVSESAYHISHEHHYRSKDFELATLTLKRMIDFFTLNKQKIIVDGMLGVRAVEGVLEELIEYLPSNNKFYKSLYSLYKHYRKAAHIIIKEMEHQDEDNDNYYYTRAFHPLIKNAVRFQRAWRDLRWNLIFKKINSEKNAFTQKAFSANKHFNSDRCIRFLLGTATPHQDKCDITRQCIDMETQINTAGYILTHQMVYFLVGESRGCEWHLNNIFEDEEDKEIMYDGLASNIAYEMIKERNTVQSLKNITNLDLFFEQGYVAASFGIVEAINFKNLRELFKLVSPNGCVEDGGKLHAKRGDSLLSGCSQHLISVAMGYISQHIRFIVTPP